MADDTSNTDTVWVIDAAHGYPFRYRQIYVDGDAGTVEMLTGTITDSKPKVVDGVFFECGGGRLIGFCHDHWQEILSVIGDPGTYDWGVTTINGSEVLVKMRDAPQLRTVSERVEP